MKAKKILSLLLIITMLLSTMVLNVSASDNNYDELGGFKSEAELMEYFTDNSVPTSKQEILINKLQNRIAWDCYNPEKVKLVPEDFSWFEAPDKVQEKYFRFEDGSFIKVSIGGGETIKNYSPDQFSTRTVTTDPYGSLYVNHKVSKTVGLTNAYFYANFYVARPGFGSSKIYTYDNSSGRYNAPFGEGITGFGVTASPTKVMIREVENTSTSQAAMFRLVWFNQVTVSASWTIGIAGGGGTAPIGSTCSLYLALINGRVYIDSGLPF